MGKAVKAVAAVAVGVAVGFATGNPYLGVLAGGAMFASSSLTPEANIGASTQTELKQVIRSSKEPAHYQFGRCAVGGLLAWAQEEEGDQTKEWLHLVYVLSEGDIESLDELYLNQEPAADAEDLVDYALIRSPSAANQYLLDNSPDWRDSQIGKGLSYVRLSLKYDRDYWASGIPTPLFVMRGNREIYDPRTETTGYSDNWALVILWYLRTRLGVPDDEIIWEMFISAANVSDETVTTPDGGTERRYTIGGGFKADARKDRVLADMEAAGGGQVVRIGGKFGLMAGAYYGPYELTIDEDMVIGAVSGQTEVAQADAVNTMTGKFIDPDQRWSETDYPAVSVAEWIEADGGPIEDSLDLQYVFSPYQAQRLANIALRRKRAGGSLSLTLNFRGYACRPGRVVRVYLPSINIDGEFRITDWDFHGDSGCKVTLSSEDPEIYDDAVGEPYDPLGFISLPTGGIAAPSGLTYTLETVGETIQGRLDWSAVSGAQSYSVVLRSNGQAVQAIEVPPNSTTCTIGGLPAGQYVAEVRTRGSFGQSGAATVTFSVNAPPMPDSVIVQVTNNEVTLIPQLAWNGTPVSFRFYYSPTLLDANQVRGSAQLLSTGASLVHTGRSFGTTYYYWIESVNAYGHSDLFFQEVATTSDFTEEEARINEIIYRDGGLADQFQNGLDESYEAIAEAQQSIDDLKAQVDALDPEGQGARIDELQQIIETEEKMQAIRYLGLRAQSMNGAAQQDTDRIVEANNRYAISQRVNTLSTDFSGNKATVDNRLTALSQADSALAQRVDNYQVEVSDQFASVNQNISAVYNPTTGAVARAVTTVNVNGRRGMLGIQVDGQLAEIIGIADQFAILNEISGELVTAFVVKDGRVIIPEALIDSLVVTKLRSTNGNLVFDGDKLKADYIDVNNLTVKWANVKDIVIKWADIQDVEIDGATIKNASIDTLQLAGNAVTINASQIYSGAIGISESWSNIIDLAYDPQGNDLDIFFSASFDLTAADSGTGSSVYCRARIQLQVTISGAVEYDFGSIMDTRNTVSNPNSGSNVTSRVDSADIKTLFTRLPGWSGNRTVRIRARAIVNGTLIGCSAEKRGIKLSVTKR
ncbi:phage tail tip protein J-related protein [Salinicola socius]|uniref:phage tail tip protein J-related protein n=1 Tax=Salinicola socius TaxID=404433 RepID=UPI000DA171B2|nr:phage tail protein [Salinicola socius]